MPCTAKRICAQNIMVQKRRKNRHLGEMVGSGRLCPGSTWGVTALDCRSTALFALRHSAGVKKRQRGSLPSRQAPSENAKQRH